MNPELPPQMSDIPNEGYVKYQTQRVPKHLPEFSLFNSLNKIRTKLYNKNLIGLYPNGIGFGNISIRYRDESFIISGTATGTENTLTKDQYCIVTSCDLRNNTVYTEGMIDASSESMSHGIIYATLPEINAVIHIHSRSIFDFMLARKYLKTESHVPYGTPEMAFAIADLITKTEKHDGIFVMGGHDEGIIAYGKDLFTAYCLIKNLYEKAILGGK